MLELIHNIAFSNNPGNNPTEFNATDGLEFDFVTELTIDSSWENLTDTATLVFPRKIRYKRNGEVIRNIVQGNNALFKRGDAFKADIGYGVQVAERFRGYVSNITPRNPLLFSFEDGMYLLKQEFINNFSSPDITLDALLTNIMPSSFPFRTNANVNLGRIRITRSSVANVLRFLRDQYGIISYVRDGQLVSGVAYDTRNLNELTLHDINLENVGIDTSDLTFVRDDDQHIKVRAVSIFDDNTKIEVVVGDDNGAERTQYFYGVDRATLELYAEEQLEKFKYTGFEGSFTTFVNPYIQHGDAIRLQSDKIPDANGVYLVKRVVTRSGVLGGRQTVELDVKI